MKEKIVHANERAASEGGAKTSEGFSKQARLCPCECGGKGARRRAIEFEDTG